MTMHTRDGNWRIHYRDPRRRRTVYVTVADGIIVDIQPELTYWLDRPFTQLCQWMRKRYPKTFDREHWSEQLIEPPEPNAPDEQDYHDALFMPTPEQITATCAVIQSRWSVGDERERRTGTSVKEPYTIPGVSTDALPGSDPHPVDGPLVLDRSETEAVRR